MDLNRTKERCSCPRPKSGSSARPTARLPCWDWLGELVDRDRRAYLKCRELIDRLELFGHELRRPSADFLQDGIYELRARVGRVNYRILYFFHGRQMALLAHGLTKEKSVPKADFNTALTRKRLFETDPERHTYREDDDG